jgi:hypothetical protein
MHNVFFSDQMSKMLFGSGLQGLEQAGDTLAPEIILEPSLAAALHVAEAPWGTLEQQVTLPLMHYRAHYNACHDYLRTFSRHISNFNRHCLLVANSG